MKKLISVLLTVSFCLFAFAIPAYAAVNPNHIGTYYCLSNAYAFINVRSTACDVHIVWSEVDGEYVRATGGSVAMTSGAFSSSFRGYMTCDSSGYKISTFSNGSLNIQGTYAGSGNNLTISVAGDDYRR